MRTYTVRSGIVVEGIALDKDGMIALGEEGRARRLTRVPVPAGAETEDGVLYSVPGASLDALVCIRDHSGFRGGWRLRGAYTPAEWLAWASVPPPPWPTEAPTGVAEVGSIAHREAQSAALPDERPSTMVVVALGECAQGDAGRMGGGPELLIVLRHACAVEVYRHGRLYGAQPILRLTCLEGRVEGSDPRAAAISALAAQTLEAATAGGPL